MSEGVEVGRLMQFFNIMKGSVQIMWQVRVFFLKAHANYTNSDNSRFVYGRSLSVSHCMAAFHVIRENPPCAPQVVRTSGRKLNLEAQSFGLPS